MPRPTPEPSTARVLARVVSAAAFLVVALWAAFFWMESEQEVRVLCGMFPPGGDVAEVRTTLDTGLYLESRLVLDELGDRIVVDSPRSLRQATCVVRLDGARVVSAEYSLGFDLPRWSALIALAVILVMIAFQAALAAGAPLGALAWGGQHRRLPSKLRAGSAASVALFAGMGLLVLQAGGFVSWNVPPGVVQTGLWSFTILFGFSTLANSASGSLPERLTGTPVAFLLCVASTILALTH
jgi:hypothetical protein